jgi:hypothetical protein
VACGTGSNWSQRRTDISCRADRFRSSACPSSCSRILSISAAGGRIGVADPADDLLIAADDDPLGHQVLGEHAFEIGLVDRDVFGVAASGQRRRIEAGFAAELTHPFGRPHPVPHLFGGMLAELGGHIWVHLSAPRI